MSMYDGGCYFKKKKIRKQKIFFNSLVFVQYLNFLYEHLPFYTTDQRKTSAKYETLLSQYMAFS